MCRRPAPRPIPKWVSRVAKKQLRGRQEGPVTSIDSIYEKAIAKKIRDISSDIDRGVLDCYVERRYPFLAQRLIEYSLGLPASMRTHPARVKWILRESMSGILPEKIRTRRTKGWIDARLTWSIAHEYDRLNALIATSVLAEVGCVEPGGLRTALLAAARGNSDTCRELLPVLALESWLAAGSRSD